MSIGERLKEYRNYKALSIQDMAKLIGISQGNLSSLENNIVKPSTKTINKIVSNLDINLTWLLSGEGPMLKTEQIDEEEQKIISLGIAVKREDREGNRREIKQMMLDVDELYKQGITPCTICL